MKNQTRNIRARIKPLYCSKCGRELDMWDRQNNFVIHRSVHYGSKYDMTEVSVRLCNRCFDTFADSCVNSPVTKEYE